MSIAREFAIRFLGVPRNPPPKTTDESGQAEVDKLLRDGWRIESQTPTQVVLVKGEPFNHVLHLLLSIFTAGLWLPVWFLKAISPRSGMHRRVVKL